MVLVSSQQGCFFKLKEMSIKFYALIYLFIMSIFMKDPREASRMKSGTSEFRGTRKQGDMGSGSAPSGDGGGPGNDGPGGGSKPQPRGEGGFSRFRNVKPSRMVGRGG